MNWMRRLVIILGESRREKTGGGYGSKSTFCHRFPRRSCPALPIANDRDVQRDRQSLCERKSE